MCSHGLGDTARTWGGVVRAVSRRREVVVWDLPGHGESDRTDDPAAYSRDAALAHIEVLAGDSPAVLVGHSLGGYFSLACAIAHPECVAGLVLVATGPGYRDPEARQRWNDRVTGLAESFDMHPAATGLVVQRDSLVIDGLDAIAVPTAVLVGELDTRFHAGAAHLAETIPRARRAVVVGAGHHLQRSHPEAVADAVEQVVAAGDV